MKRSEQFPKSYLCVHGFWWKLTEWYFSKRINEWQPSGKTEVIRREKIHVWAGECEFEDSGWRKVQTSQAHPSACISFSLCLRISCVNTEGGLHEFNSHQNCIHLGEQYTTNCSWNISQKKRKHAGYASSQRPNRSMTLNLKNLELEKCSVEKSRGVDFCYCHC